MDWGKRMIRLVGFGFALTVVGFLGSCSPQVRGETCKGEVGTGASAQEQEQSKTLSDLDYPETPEESEAIKAYFWKSKAGYQWLADHQNDAGYWSARDYAKDSIRTKRGPIPAKVTNCVDFRNDMAAMHRSADHDTGIFPANLGVSGLALLAFVGDGNTNKDGRYATNVSRAAKYIMSTQDAEGCFGSRDAEIYMFNHGVCTMAICELYEMTLAPAFKGKAQKAVDFIIRCKNPGMGWRSGVHPSENDTEATSWMVLALKSAKTAGLTFEEAVGYGGANAWYDKVTQVEASGVERVGYDRPGAAKPLPLYLSKYANNPCMDAMAMMGRIFTGARNPDDGRLCAQAKVLCQHPPTWYIDGDESHGPWNIDMQYWYFASLALYQMGDEYWKPWGRAIVRMLPKYQRGWHPKDVAKFGERVKQQAFISSTGEENPDAGRWLLDEHGSWDPVDSWGGVGGRVYSTAINMLTLSVFYRYGRNSESRGENAGE